MISDGRAMAPKRAVKKAMSVVVPTWTTTLGVLQKRRPLLLDLIASSESAKAQSDCSHILAHHDLQGTNSISDHASEHFARKRFTSR